MSSLNRSRDAIDGVAAMVGSAHRIVKYAVFGPELVDRRAPTQGVVLTEHVSKITDQQSRYAVGHHLSPLSILRSPDAEIADIGPLVISSRCMRQRKV